MKFKIISIPEEIFNTIAKSNQSKVITKAYNTDNEGLAAAIADKLLPKLKGSNPNDRVSITIKILDSLVESIDKDVSKV